MLKGETVAFFMEAVGHACPPFVNRIDGFDATVPLEGLADGGARCVSQSVDFLDDRRIKLELCAKQPDRACDGKKSSKHSVGRVFLSCSHCMCPVDQTLASNAGELD